MISSTLFSSICIYLLTCQHHLHARPSIPVQQGLAPVGGTAAGITCVSPSDSRLPRGGGVLAIMAYMGRLRPKGVPFSGYRYLKG